MPPSAESGIEVPEDAVHTLELSPLHAEMSPWTANEQARCLGLLAELRLPELTAYLSAKEHATYQDSVVGMRHAVDVGLPARVLSAVREASGSPAREVLTQLLADYQEPIVAHQDDDFVFKRATAENVYLGIHSLASACAQGKVSEQRALTMRQLVAGVPGAELVPLLHLWRQRWDEPVMDSPSACTMCDSPRRAVWTYLRLPRLHNVLVGNWISLQRCPRCGALWVSVAYEPYAAFEFLARWPYGREHWQRTHALDTGESLKAWHAQTVLRGSAGLESDEQLAIQKHSARLGAGGS